MKFLLKIADDIGHIAVDLCVNLGHLGVFLVDTFKAAVATRFKLKKAFYQMKSIGVDSLGVVILTGASTGGVLAYQSYQGLSRFSSAGEQFLSPIVFISMAREFGPVLSAIMVTARSGSAMTAEIGTMKITEQVDALITLCVNPFQYLIVPRIVAATLIMPYLALFCSMFGIIAGYIVSVYLLGVNGEMYMKSIKETVELYDITSGLIKSAVFGFLFSWICCYKGYNTTGGAKGVGLSTTQSVVLACIAIFISDYLLTSLMFSAR